METAIIISILGTITAVTVSIIGAFLANRNSVILQIRKLKEEHYVAYIEALHCLVGDNKSPLFLEKYVLARNKLFLIASENVIKKLLEYEEEAVGKETSLHDVYLTKLVSEIRKDLRIKDKSFPDIYLKKSTV